MYIMLEKLAVNHKMWISMVRNMGCDEMHCEDIVQEMYLRIHKYVEDGRKIMFNDDEVNRFYVYVVLRNLYFDYLKAKNLIDIETYNYVEDDEDIVIPDTHIQDDELSLENMERELYYDNLLNKLNEIVGDFGLYLNLLFYIYFIKKHSLRKISKGTGIGVSSLHNSVKNIKSILKEKLGEDYEDFLNKDFHLL